jgi:hypothetical protein
MHPPAVGGEALDLAVSLGGALGALEGEQRE